MPRWRSSTGTAPMLDPSSRRCWKGDRTRSASSARSWAPTVAMSWTRSGGRCAIRRRSRAVASGRPARWPGSTRRRRSGARSRPGSSNALLAEDWFLGPRWVDLLRPASHAMIPPLSDLARTADDRDDRRARATRIFLEYAAAEPEWLADLVGDADARQFAELLPRLALASNRDRSIVRLRAAAAPAPDDATTDDSRPGPRDMAARRRARRAAALFRLGAPETAWGLLGSADDPRVQAETIHALAECDAEPGPLVARLGEEADPAARRGLLLALGDLAPRIPEAVRQGLVPRLVDVYRDEPDPGIHGAVAATPLRPRPGPIRRAGRPFPGRRRRVRRAAMVHRPGAHHGRHRPEERRSRRTDRSRVRHRRSRSHPGAIPAVPPGAQPQAAREHEPRLPRGRTDVVPRGRLLPLARRSRSSPGGRMLLSADPGDQGGHARTPGIPPADRPPAADVRRVGVRLPDRDRHRPPFRQSRRAPRRIRLVLRQLGATDSSRRAAQAQRVRPVRHAGQCARVVPRELSPRTATPPAAMWRIRARSTAASAASSAAVPTFIGPMESAPIPATRSAPRPSGTTPAAGWCAPSERIVDAGFCLAYNDPDSSLPGRRRRPGLPDHRGRIDRC